MMALKKTEKLPVLTAIEKAVLKRTAAGQPVCELAELYGMTPDQTEEIFASVSAKLKAENRMLAVVKAMRLGLID